MKKLTILSLLIIAIVLTLGLASCGDVEFEVKFIVDGEVYESVTTKGNEKISIPENPSKEGYIFDGWYWDNEIWEKPFTANSLLDAPLSSDMNVYCKWKIKEHLHEESDWIIDNEASCKLEGSKHKVCTECNEVIKTEAIPKTDDHIPVTDARIEPTDAEDGLTEGSHCSECGEIIVAQEKIPALIQGVAIKSAGLTIADDKISGVFSNATEIFSFINDIKVAKDASYIIAKDIYCENVIASKTAPLEPGDNLFYLLVTNGNDMKIYTVTLRRRPMYTVSFNTLGGSAVENQVIEEGSVAVKPANPTLIGYTFESWNYDFANPITKDTEIKAIWSANTNTAYKVEYYIENLTKTGYDYSYTKNFQGTTDTKAEALIDKIEHFTFNEDYAENVLEGNIAGDGSLVLKVYYTRNTYTVTTSISDSKGGTVTNGGSYPYDTEISLTVNIKPGYIFNGWKNGDSVVSTNKEYKLTVSSNATLVANVSVAGEMESFNFTSTATTCIITGVKDKTIASVIIPDYVTSIGSWAFENCTSLTSVVIPSSVTSVGYYAFQYCNSLTIYCEAVSQPSSWHSDWNYSDCPVTWDYKNNDTAIDGCIYTVVDGVRYGIKDEVATVVRQPGNISISNIASNIAYKDAVYSVTSIGEDAFAYCSSLTSVVIPNSVTNIGDNAFGGCYSLTSITVDEDNTAYKSIDGNLYTKDGKTLVKYARAKTDKSFEIPNGVASIGDYAFAHCDSLTSVVIPNSVISIGAYAFSGCGGLTSVIIPRSVSSVGHWAFWACNGLTVYCEAAGKPSGWDSEWNYLSRYKSNPVVWYCNNNDFADDGYIYTIVDGVRYGIKKGVATVVEQPRNITTANIASSITYKDAVYSVTSIGEDAFAYCSSLTSVVIPNSVTNIGDNAFSECRSLESVVIHNSVTSLGRYAFRYCENLTIYCEAPSKPTGWDSDWNSSNRPVVWGYKGE